jgi:hypothetical protein
VPSALDHKARRVAAHANVALVATIFEVRILTLEGAGEDAVFGFKPRAEQLMRNKSRKKVPEVVRMSLVEAEDMGYYDWDPIEDGLWADVLVGWLLL